MQIQRVRGRDLRDALTRARELVGSNALVLSHERMSDGGITVAVTLDEARTARPTDAGLVDVERALQRSGCSRAWIERVLERVSASEARGSFALDAAAKILGESVVLARSRERVAHPLVIALVGPAGVGKTTTVTKLAAHFARAQRRVAMVALDTNRPGAMEPLARLARLIQAPFESASNANALRVSIERSRARDVVLIDTRGDARTDSEVLAATGSEFARTTYLVAPATSTRTALEESARAFEATRVDALVITKLDETRAPAAALEFAAESKTPLALLCNGRELAGRMHRADAERVADLFLRGKLAA